MPGPAPCRCVDGCVSRHHSPLPDDSTTRVAWHCSGVSAPQQVRHTGHLPRQWSQPREAGSREAGSREVQFQHSSFRLFAVATHFSVRRRRQRHPMARLEPSTPPLRHLWSFVLRNLADVASVTFTPPDYLFPVSWCCSNGHTVAEQGGRVNHGCRVRGRFRVDFGSGGYQAGALGLRGIPQRSSERIP